MGSDRNLKGVRKDGVEIPIEVGLNVITMPDGLLIVSNINDISERRRFEQAQEFLLRELDHRVKNTLATVQSLAEQTLESSASLEDFGKAFGERMGALARIHGALNRRNWVGLSLRRLIEMMLAPFSDERNPRVSLAGEAFAVSLRSIRPIGMAIHELATNAAKYGALSVTQGQVQVSWREDESTAGPNRLVIEWSESGGPPVVQPSRRGVGMKLIEEGVPYELGGQALLRFPVTGACCEIDVPFPNPYG